MEGLRIEIRDGVLNEIGSRLTEQKPFVILAMMKADNQIPGKEKQRKGSLSV